MKCILRQLKIVHTCYKRNFKDLATDLLKSARFAPDLLPNLALPGAKFKTEVRNLRRLEAWKSVHVIPWCSCDSCLEYRHNRLLQQGADLEMGDDPYPTPHYGTYHGPLN